MKRGERGPIVKVRARGGGTGPRFGGTILGPKILGSKWCAKNFFKKFCQNLAHTPKYDVRFIWTKIFSGGGG